jgi:outer membrane protein assembly factor BamD (BamD/ComL family)
MKGMLLTLLFFSLFSFTACTSSLKNENNKRTALEKELVGNADKLFKNKKYSDGVRLLTNYLKKYPDSQYSDDAAYRLAYVCVIADKENSYYNYKNAELRFRKVIEKYPETNYFSACKNWIKILNLYNSKVTDKTKISSTVPGKDNYPGKKALINENKVLKQENERLKKTLSELEEALQR